MRLAKAFREIRSSTTAGWALGLVAAISSMVA